MRIHRFLPVLNFRRILGPTGRVLAGKGANPHLASLCLVLLMSFQLPAAAAQNNEWAWVKGGRSFTGLSVCKPGVYGAFQKHATRNTPGGRTAPVAWADTKGSFWLFGGLGCDSAGNADYLDDLWEFDPSTHEWAWMAGRSELPGFNETQAPVYGTFRTPGKGNTPGARQNPAVWTDSKGNLWLFGGLYLADQASVNAYWSYLDDLWEFDTTVKEWAWMGGSSTLPICSPDAVSCEQGGVYGRRGVPNASNLPGGRHYAASWTDKEGNIWIFGGVGADSTGLLGELNDLWKFNPSTREWTWMDGSSTLVPCANGYGGCSRAGVYGTRGEPARGNLPGGRADAVVWTGRNGEFWLFGGDGVDSLGNPGAQNDLWEFNPSTREWAWMGGSNTNSDGEFGIYGTLQTPAAGNAPGERTGAVGWTDNRGDLWLFGGGGYDAADPGWASTICGDSTLQPMSGHGWAETVRCPSI